MNSLKFIVFLLSLSLTRSLNNNENHGKPRDKVNNVQIAIEHYKQIINLYRNNTSLRAEKFELCEKKFVCVAHENGHLNESIGLLNGKLTVLQKLNVQLNYSLDCKTQAFHKLEAQFNISQSTISELEQLLAGNFSEVQSKNEEIVRKNKEIQELTKVIIDKNTTIDQLESQAKLTSKQLEEQSAKIQTLQLNITKSTASIAEMSQDIANLKKRVSADNERIEKLNKVIAAYEVECEVKSCETFKTSTEVHLITVKGLGERFKVRCDGQMAGPGWTVIQRRQNGTVDFYRNWEEYKNGFGDLDSDFFIGLEKLHHITKTEPHELYIYLEDFEGETRFVRYDNFAVGSEQQMYALIQLGNKTGSVIDEMKNNKDQKFTTFDRDNDSHQEINCAESLHGGWWYNKCGQVNLNGKYKSEFENEEEPADGIYWADEAEFHDYDYSLKKVQMMIRPARISKNSTM